MKELEREVSDNGYKEKYYELEKDDLFYVSSVAFRTWNLDISAVRSGMKIEGLNNSEMLFAVKYIGDGIVEEMVTGEQFLINEMCSLDVGNGNRDISYNSISPHSYLNLSKSDSREDSKLYIDRLNKAKEIVNNYPLTIGFDDRAKGIYDKVRLRSINDYNNKRYIKFSNEERKAFISQAKFLAKKSVNEIISQIDKNIAQAAISKEDLDLAYLENDLYDFAHKGKSK